MTTILTAENLPMEMRKYDFNVILIDLDEMIGESIMQNSDDSYTIIINSKWSAEMQRKCFEHALDHVRTNDFECEEDIQTIEARAHRG